MGERLSKTAEDIKRNARKVGALAAIGGLSLLASGCELIPKSHSEEVTTHNLNQARLTALTKYEHGLKRISPAGKFAMQYLGEWNADVVKTQKSDYTGEDWEVKDFYRFQINNACLRGTAYDIAGGDFNVSAKARSFFSSSSADAHGNIPAAAANAYVDLHHPDKLIIESGHSSSRNLYFENAQGVDPLVPLGDQTKSVLFATYGCDTGLVRHATIEAQLDRYHPIEPQYSIYPVPGQ